MRGEGTEGAVPDAETPARKAKTGRVNKTMKRTEYAKRMLKAGDGLRGGETVNGLLLPTTVTEFYNFDYPHGENHKWGVFETAGKRWNVPQSKRLEPFGEIVDCECRRPTKAQDFRVDGRYHAYVANVRTTLTNDRNVYCTGVNIYQIDPEDPWDRGCDLASNALKAVFGRYIDIIDWDSGPTIEFDTEDDLLKAMDALKAKFGDKALFRADRGDAESEAA